MFGFMYAIEMCHTYATFIWACIYTKHVQSLIEAMCAAGPFQHTSNNMCAVHNPLCTLDHDVTLSAHM